jgi:FkbM family methyltransferase
MNLGTLVNSVLKKIGLQLFRYDNNKQLYDINEFNSLAEAKHDLDILYTIENIDANKLLQILKRSKSQLRQDIFALSKLNFKNEGFFVEFGATNGMELSNTYLLEKEFGWSGILAEPATCWHEELRKNRNAIIETNCVWVDSKSILNFTQVATPELSTISNYSKNDMHLGRNKNAESYQVKTISLNDLLLKHNAPKSIDYLSIDTEGSEFEILNAFDFKNYSFSVITVEHNYTANRSKIFNLLSKHGYTRVFEGLSKFDDWYILNKN